MQKSIFSGNAAAPLCLLGAFGWPSNGMEGHITMGSVPRAGCGGTQCHSTYWCPALAPRKKGSAFQWGQAVALWVFPVQRIGLLALLALAETTFGPLNCPDILSFPGCPQCMCIPVTSVQQQDPVQAVAIISICFGPTDNCSSWNKRPLQKKNAGELWILHFNGTKLTLHGNKWQLLVSGRELNSLGTASIPNDSCDICVFSVLPLGVRHMSVWLTICHHPAHHRGFWGLLMATYTLVWSYQTTCALEALNIPRSTVEQSLLTNLPF